MRELERMVWRRGDPRWSPPELWGFGRVVATAAQLSPFLFLGALVLAAGPPVLTLESGLRLDGLVFAWSPGLAVVGAILGGGFLPSWIGRSGIAVSASVAARLGLLGLGAAMGAVGVVSWAWVMLGTFDRAVPG